MPGDGSSNPRYIPSGFHTAPQPAASSLPPPPPPGSGMQQQSIHYNYGNTRTQAVSVAAAPVYSCTSRYAHHPQQSSHSARQQANGRPINLGAPHPSRMPPHPLRRPPHVPSPASTTQQHEPPRKRPRRDPSLFQCDPCELLLESQSALEAHRASHTKCSLCSFAASPKVVKGHFQSAHGKFSGRGFKTVTIAVPGCPVQRFRICVGNRPEDVQQWIADRKKKFPRMKRREEENPEKQNTAAAKSNEEPARTEAENSKPLSALLAGYGSSDSEEESTDVPKSVPPAEVKKAVPKDETNENVPEAISSSAATTDAQEQQQRPRKDASGPAQAEKQRGICRAFARTGKCRRGASCHYLHPDSAANLTPQQQHQQECRSATLLRKLLTKEMERESALTVQLLKYIVESDFLQREPPQKHA